jgi:pimeloyl-ACP methyl ester carboxylesterase
MAALRDGEAVPDKKTRAGDIAGVLDRLKIDGADLVTHDIGNMVDYAFAAQYPDRFRRFVFIAPLPSIGLEVLAG